jgi:hypothetical protein
MPIQSADEDCLIRRRQHRDARYGLLPFFFWATATKHTQNSQDALARRGLDDCSKAHLVVLDDALLLAGLPAFADALEDDARASLSRASLASFSLCVLFAFCFALVRSFCLFSSSCRGQHGFRKTQGLMNLTFRQLLHAQDVQLWHVLQLIRETE